MRRCGKAVMAVAVGLAGLLAGATEARANCAMPVTYDVTVEGNRVTICPQNFSDRMCPDSSGLLRQDPSSSEVVRLADDCDESKCFVDECVAPGTYRYGFADPYECSSASCGTDYFQEVTVTDSLGTCERTEGRQAPTAFTGQLPWGEDPSICGYGGLGGCGVPAAAVWPVNAMALAGGLWLLARRKRG